jgi:Flp pilus assembly protein TadD
MLLFREQSPRNGKRSKRQDLEFEIAFFGGLARRDPRCVEALQLLGDAYTKSGELKRGLQIDRRLARLCPADPIVFYNLCCSLALLNRVDDAFAALERAVRLGYRDAKWLAKDPDLANLRNDRRFDRIRAKLTRPRR